MLKKLSLVLLLVLIACHSSPIAYRGSSDTKQFAMANRVKSSPGGFVMSTLDVLDYAAANNHHQVIDGRCMSSCALVIIYPHVCWTKETEFWFHGATGGAQATLIFLSLYPGAVTNLLPTYMTRSYWYMITGGQMADLLQKNLCD